MTAERVSPKIFISYSHKDVYWKDLVSKHLRVLELAGGELTIWDDRRIAAGDEWRNEIESAISSAEVAVLLISADFLTSGFIRDTEIPRLLERRRSEGLRVIPLFVRPCAWKVVGWLAALQGAPAEGETLSALPKHQAEDYLSALALAIGELIGRRPPIRDTPAPQPLPSPPDLAGNGTGEADCIQTASAAGVVRHAWSFGFTTLRSVTAPALVVLGSQWILCIVLMFGKTNHLGYLFGFWSPLWLLPTSYLAALLLKRDGARLVGGLVGGIVSAAVVGPDIAGNAYHGFAFGAFFGAGLAGCWSEPAKRVTVLWASLSTAALILFVGGPGYFVYPHLPLAYTFVGTTHVIGFWCGLALLAAAAWWLWKLWPRGTVEKQDLRAKERDEDE